MACPDPQTTLLLIDDNDISRTYYADQLRISSPNYVVLEAKDGQAGLDLYKSKRVDCIVAELKLPDMSVFELLLDVVPPASRQEVAIVILTRAVLPSSADHARRHGAQAVLLKRLTSGDELAQAVRKAIAVIGLESNRDPNRK